MSQTAVFRLSLFVFALVASLGALQAQHPHEALITRALAPDLTPADARKILQELREAANASPEHTAELDAAAIPAQRILNPGKPAPAPAPAAPTGPEKTLLILRVPGQKTAAVVATAVRETGDVITVTDVYGKQGIIQRKFLSQTLPWSGDWDLEKHDAEIDMLAARYEVLSNFNPELKPLLAPEAQRMRKYRADRASVQAGSAQGAKAAVERTRSIPYEQERAYTAEDLAQLLLSTESLRAVYPEVASELDGLMTPFWEHFKRVIAGQVWTEGRWQNLAEVKAAEKARELAEKEELFSRELHFELSRNALPEALMRNLLVFWALPIAVLAFLGMVLVFVKTPGWCRPLGAVLAIAPIGLSILYVYRLLGGQVAPPPARGTADSEPKISRLLFKASLGDPSAIGPEERRVTLSEKELETFLNSHLTFTGPETSVSRTNLAIRFRPGIVSIHDQVRFRDQLFKITYNLRVEALQSGDTVVSDVSVVLGDARVFPPLSAWLGQSLASEIGKILTERRLFATYTLASSGEGAVELVLRSEAPRPNATTVGLEIAPDQVPAATESAAEPVPLESMGPGIQISPAEPAASESPSQSNPGSGIQITPANP